MAGVWHARNCDCVVEKMSRDVGMVIRKNMVLPFLPCLVAFWNCIPIICLSGGGDSWISLRAL